MALGMFSDTLPKLCFPSKTWLLKTWKGHVPYQRVLVSGDSSTLLVSLCTRFLVQTSALSPTGSVDNNLMWTCKETSSDLISCWNRSKVLHKLLSIYCQTQTHEETPTQTTQPQKHKAMSFDSKLIWTCEETSNGLTFCWNRSKFLRKLLSIYCQTQTHEETPAQTTHRQKKQSYVIWQ